MASASVHSGDAYRPGAAVHGASYYHNPTGNKDTSASEFARRAAENFKVRAPEREKYRITFSQMVRQIIEAKNINVMRFQERTLLSKATFYRLQNDKNKQSFRSILAFCAGYDLDIYETQQLLGKAGFAFDGSEAHTAYMTAISQFPGYSIDIRNEFLASLDIEGLVPLGDNLIF